MTRRADEIIGAAFDGRDGSRRALDAALVKAASQELPVVIVAVASTALDLSAPSLTGIVPPDDEATHEIRGGAVPPALRPILNEGRSRADAFGVRAKVVFGVGDPATEIVRLAQQHGVTELFIGAHHRRLLDTVTGGDTVRTVTHRAGCDVVVID
jgi:nucleotide-binding universal stress UspA family protein